jgi:hypothetical protein
MRVVKDDCESQESMETDAKEDLYAFVGEAYAT